MRTVHGRETRRFGRRAAIRAGCVAVLGAAWALSPAGGLPTAHAGQSCGLVFGVMVCRYTGAGAYAFTVPSGVSQMSTTVIGGSGGSSPSGVAGGLAGEVQATLYVTAGETLYMVVGANGQSENKYGGSSYNGGGAAHAGGSGGGASDIRTCAPGSSGCTLTGNYGDPRLLVAGGGGGGGETNPDTGTPTGGTGGNGGDNTPANGYGGQNCGPSSSQINTQGVGGGGGSGMPSSSGGSGGSAGGNSATAGSAGQGGSGDHAQNLNLEIVGSGGGGGGWFGGGGGSDDLYGYPVIDDPQCGAGGGAGSSYAAAAANNVIFSQAAAGSSPEIQVAYLGPAPTAVPYAHLRTSISHGWTTLRWEATLHVVGFNVMAGSRLLNPHLLTSRTRWYHFRIHQVLHHPGIVAVDAR